MSSVDLYFNTTQNVTLSVQGTTELHLSGFFEPNRDEIDDGMFLDAEEEDEEEEILLANGAKGANVNKNLQ